MLRLNCVKKSYPSFELDCSLGVKPGCVTGLIGQNGAGKSTTFKAILGLISPDGGEIELFGKPVHCPGKEEKERIGVVLSDSGFCGYLNVQTIASMMDAMYERFDKALFLERCRQFGLPLKKAVKEFSTGMRAQLKVLAAISYGADLLILDEPTAGLDVVARDAILDLLRTYMEEEENRSILISSHISGDLEGFCDDLYMIHGGRVILHEETDVLLSDYGLLKVSKEQYRNLDQKYLLRKKEESFGFSCLTDQKQYYMENYPDIVVERGCIDETMMMMIKGEQI